MTAASDHCSALWSETKVVEDAALMVLLFIDGDSASWAYDDTNSPSFLF